MDMDTRRAVTVLPVRWRRDPGVRLRGHELRLGTPVEYEAAAPQLAGRGDLLSDLAAVGAADPDDAPALAAALVRRHGLLRQGPNSPRVVEAVAEIRAAGLRLHQLIGALYAIHGATTPREKRRHARPLLAEYQFGQATVRRRQRGPDVPPAMEDAQAADDRLRWQVGLAVAAEATAGLGGMPLQVVAYPPGVANVPLALAIQPRDLLGLAYVGLMVMQHDTGRLRQCKDPQCGRWFLPDDGRRRYCPTGCAQRYNDRLAKQRQRAAEGNDQ